jgi:hypothetical protein
MALALAPKVAEPGAEVEPRALSDEVGTGSSIRKRSKCLILEQIISDQMIPSGRSLL